ncbi:hypothetical protein PV08_10680 [Exophiala spinifera]|uniref:Uncharacterized protein n=1 Tax=Exophiala spinifera TaxID=91928 RepID=A0A0D2AY92_9EURO|nr:uncharacterized protein PV08_10680 [Exophiala spinifera]KIW11380.1 hypothetical protein PV08_10680 [Exophiala spinifera]
MPEDINVIAVMTPPPSSKRFLPPSTASASRSTTHPSTRRIIFQSSRSTQLTSSHPSRPATPRFQKQPVDKDEIDTSFEDETESPIISGTFVNTHGEDLIDVDEDVLPVPSPLLYRNKIIAPPAKKRKTSHPGQRPVEPITVSSSPGSESDDHASRAPSSEASHSDFEDFEDSMIQPPYGEISKTTRFRSEVPRHTESSAQAKNAFKVEPQKDHSAHLASGSLLPDVFSPSKRKGKREYIPGGIAEQVRRWVLGIAAQDLQSVALAETSITISQARIDDSGRFLFVTDTAGKQWLLPEQQQKAGLEHRLDMTNVRPGARLLLKGQATKWPLPPDVEEVEATTVSAYWELVAPG